MSERIPFVDLVTPHKELEGKIIGVVREALNGGRFVGGEAVERFEERFARLSGARHCVGVGSGTDALRFALLAAGVRKGSMVITVPNTFIATVEAIRQVGAVPVFVDIDERTYNIDIVSFLRFLEEECSGSDSGKGVVHRATGRTVDAVVPVHLYGQTVDMDGIEDIALRYGLIIIEDACQAHGAEYYSEAKKTWRSAGSTGHAGAFSFYPGKNLGACGEAGAVTTNDAHIAERVRMIRDHGQSKKYYHDVDGYNGRLDAIQAGILDIKLDYIDEWNEKRRKVAALYNDLLSGMEGIKLPFEPEACRSVFHLYVIRTADRNGLREHLSAKNIETGFHYPLPLHLQRACSEFGYGPGTCPVAERTASEILSLPMHPHLTEQQVHFVADTVKEFMKRRTAVPG